MKTENLTIEEWNEIPKDDATDTRAIKGDMCVEIDGVAFLVQRRNNFNNVICVRIKPKTNSLLQTFNTFREWCQKEGLQYIRVEGAGKHTYKMLFLLLRLAPKEAGVVKAEEESKKYERNIYYVRTY